MKFNNGWSGSLVVLIQYRDKSYAAYAISSIGMPSMASSARAEYINSPAETYQASAVLKPMQQQKAKEASATSAAAVAAPVQL